MPKPDTWMPLYWGDYVKNTGHFSAAHHGAYLMLIKHYWCSGDPLPDSDDQLWRIACCDSVGHWRKLKPTIAAKFKISGGIWRHDRVEDELENARNFIARQSENGRKGGRPRKPPDNPEKTHGLSLGKARSNPNESPSPSPSPVRTSVPNGTAKKLDPEGEAYRRGRELLGPSAGGFITKLKRHCEGDLTKLNSLFDEAAGKDAPREWLGVVLSGEKTPMSELFPEHIYRGVDL